MGAPKPRPYHGENAPRVESSTCGEARDTPHLSNEFFIPRARPTGICEVSLFWASPQVGNGAWVRACCVEG